MSAFYELHDARTPHNADESCSHGSGTRSSHMCVPVIEFYRDAGRSLDSNARTPPGRKTGGVLLRASACAARRRL